ncbi:hypothetical protein O3P69_009477 [Scylla paramamosain]|uniref:Uncharacterized protein n=1 Tax=Scylla paramamosain TaxID=85552 RepID=A0AAW0SUW6_SCYPA
MDPRAISPRIPASEFEAEWWVVAVCVTALVCGALTSARLLHHGTSSTRSSFHTAASRVLLCSQASAGLLQVTVSSPVLLLALADCYKGKVSAWACSVGWVAWGWAWGVQVLGVLVISYERVRCMGRPLQGVLAPRTAIFLAGAAWLCGGVVGVTMGKGLQCSLVSRGQPGVAVGVLAGALLPVVLLGESLNHSCTLNNADVLELHT